MLVLHRTSYPFLPALSFIFCGLAYELQTAIALLSAIPPYINIDSLCSFTVLALPSKFLRIYPVTVIAS